MEARAESAEREQWRVGRVLHAAEEERGQLREHLRMLSEAKVRRCRLTLSNPH